VISLSFSNIGAYSKSVDELAHLRPRVVRTVAAILRQAPSHPDVEDCAQEVMARVLERKGQASSRVDATQNYDAWVLGVARHVAIDRIRARVRERNAPPLLLGQSEAPSEARAELRVLAEHVAALPESQRRALLLFHIEGKRYQEIAARMGVSMGTVATWISRARQELLQKMEAP
jgi:RNA polymerase sigma factor (sigma-70 family)